VRKFEAQLNADQELGIVISGAAPIHVVSIAALGANLVAFYGKAAHGGPAVLLQHVTQTNVVLLALPKLGEEARRVGFKAAESSPGAAMAP
jgi:hypothetical protein